MRKMIMPSGFDAEVFNCEIDAAYAEKRKGLEGYVTKDAMRVEYAERQHNRRIMDVYERHGLLEPPSWLDAEEERRRALPQVGEFQLVDDDFEPSNTALHEAGHAVVAHVLGQRVEKVVLLKKGGGYCVTEWFDELIARGCTPARVAFEYAVMALAGGTADPDQTPSPADVKIAKNAIAEAGGGAAEWARAEAEAKRLVTKHWAVIRKVALALDRFGQISGDQVARVVAGKPVLEFKPKK